MDMQESRHSAGGEAALEHRASPSIRDIATASVRYWEPRRIIYNAVLAVVVIGCFIGTWPASQRALTLDTLQALFVLAVLANVLYCAAYVPDVFAQLSALKADWIRWRWGLLVIGITFAGIFARYIALSLFAHPIGS